MTKETNIYEAILAVQQEAPFINKETNNSYYKSKYADLPTIWAAVKNIMGKNGLVVINSVSIIDGYECLTTRLVHTPTGESIESVSRISLQKCTVQEMGSFLTYMRRYMLSALLGLVTDEDDDGNAATKSQEKKPVDPDKALWNEVVAEIKGAKTLPDLSDVLDGRRDDIAKLKAKGEAAEKRLTDIENEKRKSLNELP